MTRTYSDDEYAAELARLGRPGGLHIEGNIDFEMLDYINKAVVAGMDRLDYNCGEAKPEISNGPPRGSAVTEGG